MEGIMTIVDKTQGYVIMWRSFYNSALWTNPKLFRVYDWVMYRANFNSAEAFPTTDKVKLLPGQFITSFPHAAKELKMSVGNAFRYFSVLKAENVIETKKTNKYTIVTVLNWQELQNPERKYENKLKTNGKQTETVNTIKTVNTKNTTTQEALVKIEKVLGPKYTFKDGKPYYLKGGYWIFIGNPVAFAASLQDVASAEKINPILTDPEFKRYAAIYRKGDDAFVRQKMSLEPLLFSRYPRDKYSEQWKEARTLL